MSDIALGKQAAVVRRIEAWRLLRELAVPYLALAVLLGAVGYFQPRFFSVRAFTGLALDAAPTLMLVIGASVVILVGGIDLSIATMASFAAVTYVIVNPLLGDAGVLAILLLAAAIGAVQGYVHVRAQIPSFVVSFGTLGMLYGITHYISNATAAPLSGSSLIIGFLGTRSWGIPNAIIVVVIWAAILAAAFRFTRLGRDIYATGASERAALLSGVRVRRVKMIVFAISAASAAMAGLILLSQTMYSSPAMANNFLLPTIVGVVVGGTAISGGTGGIGCALIGGLIASTVRVGTVILGLNPATQNIAFGLVILIAVAVTIDRSKIGIIK